MIIASIYPCPFDTEERHESNASIIFNEKIYSYEEAKLTTTKLDGTTKFPERSLLFGCKELKITPEKINKWVFPCTKKKINDKDLIKFFSYLKIYFKSIKSFSNWRKKNVYFVKHHLMHASLAVHSSNFKNCLYLTSDGGGDSGDDAHFSYGLFDGKNFVNKKKYKGKKSLASFHGYITDSLGLPGGENGKTSGLAAFGQVKKELLRNLNKILKIKGFEVIFNRKRYNNSKLNLTKLKAQEYDRSKIMHLYPSNTNIFKISKKYLPQDVAATGEKIMISKFLDVLKKVEKKTNIQSIVFAGGLFNNVALNNQIIESKIFKKVFFSFAPSDSGLSLGGALYIWNKIHKVKKKNAVFSPYLGPSYSDKDIKDILDKFNLKFRKIRNVEKYAARYICDGKIVGYFQGRGEIGPRSLGNRSILADPTKTTSKHIINQHLKKRDWYMPYAPSILIEDVPKYVKNKYKCHYMQVAYKVNKNFLKLKSAIHNDFTSRIHCVSKKINPKYWKLINEIKKINKIGAVLNTSFNRHGISTISSPRQAIEHLMEGSIDILIISNFCIIGKENRKYYRKNKKIISDKKNLIKLCSNRFNQIKDYLNGYEKKFYIQEFKKIKL